MWREFGTQKWSDGEPIHGLLDQWSLGPARTPMAFFSSCPLDSVPTAPDYSKDLQILIDGRVLGDRTGKPKIRFRKSFFSREFNARLDDGWVFEVHYAAPWFREFFRKLSLGGTPEYDPVDFLERLVEIVRVNRPEWLAAD